MVHQAALGSGGDAVFTIYGLSAFLEAWCQLLTFFIVVGAQTCSYSADFIHYLSIIKEVFEFELPLLCNSVYILCYLSLYFFNMVP